MFVPRELEKLEEAKKVGRELFGGEPREREKVFYRGGNTCKSCLYSS